MNIQNIPLTDIHPYARNPRKNDEAVKNVAASIREFGFLVPLVIDAGHEIVAGHTRYKAAQSLGMKEVPCVIADELTEDQIKAFRLADTGITAAHRLLAPAISDNRIQAVNPTWRTDDQDGHGTQMAGVALYRDLKARLINSGREEVVHTLESVKILHPSKEHEPSL